MTLSIFPVYELDWAAQIFKPSIDAVSSNAVAASLCRGAAASRFTKHGDRAPWLQRASLQPQSGINASLAHKLTVWQKQRHEHTRAGLRLGEPYGSERAAWVGGNAVRQPPDWRDPESFRGNDQQLEHTVLGSQWVDGPIGEVADERIGLRESMQTSMILPYPNLLKPSAQGMKK
jgi:hypothetical protein